MGKLDESTVYLAGSIESSPDAGIGWRIRFRRLVRDAGLNIKVIDPTDKPGETPDRIAESKDYQEKLQAEYRFDELKQFVHAYRRKDLRFVDYSDAIICHINPDIPQWGTANEVYCAEAQHKPIFTICDGGLRRLPRWLFDVVPLDLVFEDVEQVVAKLSQIDAQGEPLDDKWVVIRRFLK